MEKSSFENMKHGNSWTGSDVFMIIISGRSVCLNGIGIW